LRVRGNTLLPQQTVSAIRFLVAGAVEGLAVGNVSVVDNLGNVLSDNTPEDSVAGLTTTQLAARKNLEQYLTKNAQGMLDTVLGPGQSVVRVAAEINYDSLTRIEEKFDPEGQVPRTSQVTDESTVTTTQNPTSAAAGVVANATTETNNTASANLTSSNTKKKTTNSDFEINKTVDNIIQSAGGIKRLSAAVFIAAQVTGAGTNRVVAPRTPEELQKIRRVVQSALGLQEGADALRKDEITVEEMPFNDQPFALLAEQMHREQQRLLWLEYAKQGAFGLLAAAALLLFWRAYKKTPNEAIPLGVPVGELAVPGRRSPDETGPTTASHTAKPGVVTVEVLNQLIRENPANMTRAIRSWMAEGEKTHS
jgi:flagellar M-ring protein FliF